MYRNCTSIVNNQIRRQNRRRQQGPAGRGRHARGTHEATGRLLQAYHNERYTVIKSKPDRRNAIYFGRL